MTATSPESCTPAKRQDRWQLVVSPEVRGLCAAARALAELMITEVFEPSEAALVKHFGAPLPGTCAITVILAGEQAALDWDVDPDALGFHAVASARRTDPDDPSESYFEVNHEISSFINLEALVRCVRQDQVDEASLLSALVTLPHEMQHAAAWLVASQGRTPLEVFDDGEGELALMEMGRAIERQAALSAHAAINEGDAAEDAAEQFGQGVLGCLDHEGLTRCPAFGRALAELRA